MSRNNFRLKIKYTIIAEVEENPDEDEFAEDHELEEDEKQTPEKKQNLKCLANLEIFWDYKKYLDETDPYSESPVFNRWRFKIPRPLCCFLKYDISAEISIPKTIFTEGDLITFTVKLEGAPNPDAIDLRVDLFEEVSNSLISLRDSSTTELLVSFKKEIMDGKLFISGDFDLGMRVSGHSLRSEDWNVSHALDFYIRTKTFLSKHEEKYTLPCLIVPQTNLKRGTKRLSRMINESPRNEERLTLVYSKFKLEDRFDIARNQHFSEADFDDE